MKKDFQKGEIVIYKTSKKDVDLKVRFEDETLWLSQKQMSELFSVNQPAIAKHLKNIFYSGELVENSVHSILEYTAGDGKNYKTKFYNLDAIISVGYRVNSSQATQFRIWATKTLKQYLLQGYVVNEQRLLEAQSKFKELQTTVSFLADKAKKENLKGQEDEILSLLSNYSRTLTLLEQYDSSNLKEPKKKKGKFILEYEKANSIVFQVKKNLLSKKEASDIFGNERDGSFGGVVKGLYQTFDKKELYQSIEDKASHLLYLIIKDHPFTDGNKRIASFLFVYFLDQNNYLYKNNGEKKINDNALTALALLVAESNPREKETIIKLIKNLISDL